MAVEGRLRRSNPAPPPVLVHGEDLPAPPEIGQADLTVSLGAGESAVINYATSPSGSTVSKPSSVLFLSLMVWTPLPLPPTAQVLVHQESLTATP